MRSIGNPQNMLIGSRSGVSYVTFLATLGTVALAGLALNWLVVHQVSLRGAVDRVLVEAGLATPAAAIRPTRLKPFVVVGLVLAGFFAGIPAAMVAAIGAALLLITRTVEPRRVYDEVDWGTIVTINGGRWSTEAPLSDSRPRHTGLWKKGRGEGGRGRAEEGGRRREGEEGERRERRRRGGGGESAAGGGRGGERKRGGGERETGHGARRAGEGGGTTRRARAERAEPTTRTQYAVGRARTAAPGSV